MRGVCRNTIVSGESPLGALGASGVWIDGPTAWPSGTDFNIADFSEKIKNKIGRRNGYLRPFASREWRSLLRAVLALAGLVALLALFPEGLFGAGLDAPAAMRGCTQPASRLLPCAIRPEPIAQSWIYL